MANLYSICCLLSDYHESNGKDLYFVGIFDKQNLKKGIKEFISRMERKGFPSDVPDEYVQELIESDVTDEFLEEIIHDPELIFTLVGITYAFFVQEAECNTVNELQMMFLAD